MKIDLTGEKFNRLTVIKRSDKKEKQKKNSLWICQCECGNYTEVYAFCLKNGNTKSCGCLVIDSAKERHVDLIGKRFGKLTVIEKLNFRKSYTKSLLWKCKCDCGNTINVTTKDLNYGQKSCGCYQPRLKGENHPRWKGGEKSENARIRNSGEYKQWRISVFERDNYTCQCCGDNKGHNLCAHHIENFSDHEDERFDIDNGITLCNNCHNPNVIGSFHNTYGTYNNNREQLEEYIKLYNKNKSNHLSQSYEKVISL